MGKFYRLTENLSMERKWYTEYGKFTDSGGAAKAGQVFELIAEPTPKCKLYQLQACGVRFPYMLGVRPNQFKKCFIEIES